MRFYSIITRSLTCNALIIRNLLFYETSHNPWVRTVTVKLILATSTGAMFLLRRTFPRPALNGLIGRNNPKVFPSRSVGSSEPDLAVLRSANSFRASHRRARAARSDTSSSTTSRVNRRPYATLLCHSPLVETFTAAKYLAHGLSQSDRTSAGSDAQNPRSTRCNRAPNF
jgi:hypothetical protein